MEKIKVAKLVARTSAQGNKYFQWFNEAIGKYIPVYYGREVENDDIDILKIEYRVDRKGNRYTLIHVDERNIRLMLDYDTKLPFKGFLIK